MFQDPILEPEVWSACQNAFFDVRVTNTHSPSQIHFTTESVLKKHEKEKKRNYGRRNY